MIAGLLWLGEFALEASGTILFFRRRLWSPSLMLGCSALVDLVKIFLHGDAYGWAWWAAEAVQYLFLGWIAVQISAKLMAEYAKARHALVLMGMVAGLAAGAFARGETWRDRFLDAEIAAGCLLALALLVAWWARQWRLDKPWDLIAAGLLISVGGNAACAWLWKVWPGSARLYQVVDIAALGLWAMAGWRADSQKVLQGVRISLRSVWVKRETRLVQ